MSYRFNLILVSLLSGSLLLNGCSIQDETSQEIKVQRQELIKPKAKTKTQRFINKCSECILGDFSKLDEIIKTYKSSFTPSTNYPKGAFLYQKISPTLAFERCAQKAMLAGDNRAFKAMIIRQGQIARTARYFYATNKPTQGAFWLQRIINVKGEMDGLEVAGRIFIQDIRTIGVGVRLLEQSARLGNRNARQMLMGLMNPGSVYYQQLTKNSLKDDEVDQSSEAIDKYDAQLDDHKEPIETKPSKQLLSVEEDDNIIAHPSFATPLTDSEANSKSTMEEVKGGQISLFDSQDQSTTNKPKDSNKVIMPEPKNMGLGYMETAIKANNQIDETTKPNQDQHIVNSTEATINALQNHDDMELDTPIELYEADHESHQKSLQKSQEPNQDGYIMNSKFDAKKIQERQEQLKALEKKALEASKAAQKRAQELQ